MEKPGPLSHNPQEGTEHPKTMHTEQDQEQRSRDACPSPHDVNGSLLADFRGPRESGAASEPSAEQLEADGGEAFLI